MARASLFDIFNCPFSRAQAFDTIQKICYNGEKIYINLSLQTKLSASVIASETKQSHKENIENILKQALSDLQKDDPELDAVIIWAYNNRKELNQTFRAHTLLSVGRAN